MSQPLVGDWTVKQLDENARGSLTQGAKLKISYSTARGYSIAVSSNGLKNETWTDEHCYAANSLMTGKITLPGPDSVEKTFIISYLPASGHLKRRLVGLVYNSNIDAGTGGGADPGAWEAEDDGPGDPPPSSMATEVHSFMARMKAFFGL